MKHPQQLIGTWRLVSWTGMKNGSPSGFPMGDNAQGQIIYTAEGRMSAFLMRADFAGNSSQTLADADTCIAYAGRWQVSENQAIHDVEFATLPHWIGQPLVRLVKWADSDLLLSTAPESSNSGNVYVHELRWRKVSD